jgi:protein-S-isoprenylcysteine O-methyltransferase Ste14
MSGYRPGMNTAAVTPRLPLALDRIEQVAIVVLWTWLSWRVLGSVNPFAPLLLASETLIALFVLLRRPSASISVRRSDWAAAFAATLLPLLIDPGAREAPVLIVPGVLLSLFGTCWQLWAKLVLRRSFGIAPANRGVKKGGPYRGMRHPMYFGYFVTEVGILMLMPSAWNFALYGATWALQVFRLLREEELLMRDPAYRAYAAEVRWRVLPRLF